MRELSHLERWVAFLAGIIGIVVGLATLANMTGFWSRPATSPGGDAPVTEPTTGTQKEGGKKEGVTPGENQPLPTPPKKERGSIQGNPKPSEFPVQARLEDGQQRVMLAGDLSVGATFSEVASTPIATLQISHEGTSELKALQTAGGPFTVTVHGVQYHISVLNLSFESRVMTVQIDKVD